MLHSFRPVPMTNDSTSKSLFSLTQDLSKLFVGPSQDHSDHSKYSLNNFGWNSKTLTSLIRLGIFLTFSLSPKSFIKGL